MSTPETWIAVICFCSGVAAFGISLYLHRLAQELVADVERLLAVQTEQTKMIREATALAEYGATDEANDMLDKAIELGEQAIK